MEKKKIGQLLIEGGYISPGQLKEGLEIQKTKRERICNILMDLGYLSEEDFLEFLSTMPGTASIELSGFEVDQKTLELVRHELARRLELVPLGKLGNLLTVAMVCPLDNAGRKELEETTGLKVRPILCSRSAVLETLDRYYRDLETVNGEEYEEGDLSTLEGPLKLKSIARLVAGIEELPTLPDIVAKVSAVINNPDSSAADLAKVVATDASLSANILKLANSPAFGFSRKVSDIQHAIALLGFKETQALVMSVSVYERLSDSADFDFKSYWNHSFACATLSRLISRSLKAPGMENAFVAGLLHDVGKVVLAVKLRQKREKAISVKTAEGIAEHEAEEKVLGVTHAEIGYLLGEHWLLPPLLTNAIRYHHTPELEPEPKGLGGITFLANRYCKKTPEELTAGTDFDERVRNVLKGIGLSDGTLRVTLEGYAGISSRLSAL